MAEMQTCHKCGKQFDFDKEGLGSMRASGPIYVCSDACAKGAARDAGNLHAIHDKTDAIVDTNAPGLQ